MKLGEKSLSCIWLVETLRLYSPWNSPGQNTEVGSLSLLQEISSTQESNQGLLHYRQILCQLSYQGSPSRFLDGKYFLSWIFCLPTDFQVIVSSSFSSWDLHRVFSDHRQTCSLRNTHTHRKTYIQTPTLRLLTQRTFNIQEVKHAELMLSNYGAGEDSWASLGQQGAQTSQS